MSREEETAGMAGQSTSGSGPDGGGPSPVASAPRPAGEGPARRRRERSGVASEAERASFGSRVWYEVVRHVASVPFHLIGGVSYSGLENVPRSGPGLLLSNHLSHLDVMALGVGVPRMLRYVARSSLFVPVLGPLIRSVGGFPIDREGGGVAGLKETLRQLRAGQMVLIFPEGTRSPDGTIGELRPGIAALARAGAPFYPAAVAGTFESLPRGRVLPRWHPIHVHFGPPIPPEALAGLPPEALTALVRDRLLQCQAIARDGATRGTWSRDRYADH